MKKLASELKPDDIITNQGRCIRVTGLPYEEQTSLGPRLVVPTDKYGLLHKVPHNFNFTLIEK